MARVGVIGLGAMGMPMAHNLLKGPHTVTAYARRPDVAIPLVQAGARRASSPAEVASVSDVIVTMVTDAAAVHAVVLGPRGIAEGARAGTTVVDHSTIDPDAARRIASALTALGIDMLDAPVSGGSAAAAAATLSIMVGGDEAVLDRCRPILQCYGNTIVHIGPSGTGQIAKACNQICTIVNMLGAAEAMLLAERAGVDPVKVREVLMAGFGASRMLDVLAPRMIARDFEPRIESRLHDKDIHIVLAMARALGLELPASAAAAGVLGKLQARGGARLDSASIIDVLDHP